MHIYIHTQANKYIRIYIYTHIRLHIIGNFSLPCIGYTRDKTDCSNYEVFTNSAWVRKNVKSCGSKVSRVGL